MASLQRVFSPRLLKISLIRTLNSPTTRQKHWWKPDFKAGPYPKTEEERIAAAKKYNLFPEEYEPAKERFGLNIGDYPELPDESVDVKDPYYDWDFPELRRNFNDPIPINGIKRLPELLSTEKCEYTFTQELLRFFLTSGTLVFIIWYYSDKYVVQPILEKQYGYKGETHYTFELDYEELQKQKIKCECPTDE